MPENRVALPNQIQNNFVDQSGKILVIDGIVDIVMKGAYWLFSATYNQIKLWFANCLQSGCMNQTFKCLKMEMP